MLRLPFWLPFPAIPPRSSHQFGLFRPQHHHHTSASSHLLRPIKSRQGFYSASSLAPLARALVFKMNGSSVDSLTQSVATMSTAAAPANAGDFKLPKIPKESFLPDCTQLDELNQFVKPETKPVLAELLHDNHERHHCFFNTKGMHNHSSHQLIADLTLGATPEQLQHHYKYQEDRYLGNVPMSDRTVYDPYVVDKSKPGSKEIERITMENWTQHVGNARYYWSYLHFFDSQISEHGIQKSIERFVFDKDANKEGREMIYGFFGGVLHSLIHCGYGLECKMPGMVAEGLAMATSTAANHLWLLPQDWLRNAPDSPSEGKSSLLPILKDILADDRLNPQSLKLQEETASLADKPFTEGSGKGLIHKYVDRWEAVRSSNEVSAEEACHDLSLFSALLMGAVPKKGTGSGAYYHHDFFLMHLNNAHIFTPLYLSVLSPSSRSIFLRGLLAEFLYLWIARGRPAFTADHWVAERDQAKHLDWNTMFQLSCQNVDEHLPKAVRALYVFSHRFKGNPAQELAQSGIVKNSDKLTNGDTPAASDPFLLTARQLVQMHQGKIKKSQHEGDKIGAEQEFWEFEPFM